MRNKTNSFKSAFTLIELLVVMSIIVVLAGIIIPKIAGAKNKAVAVSCQSNMKGIVKALQLYCQDYPAYGCAGASGPNDLSPLGSTRTIFGALYYQADGNKVGGITTMDIYTCPALEDHVAPEPVGWKAPFHDTNGEIDYVMITSDGENLPNFLTDPDSNAIITEKTANHGGSRNVAFLGGNIKLMTDDEMEAYRNIDTDTGAKYDLGDNITENGGSSIPFINDDTTNATSFIIGWGSGDIK